MQAVESDLNTEKNTPYGKAGTVKSQVQTNASTLTLHTHTL